MSATGGSRREPARAVEVVRTEVLTPHLRRVVLGGPELAGFHPGSPASYLKLYLPPAPGEPLVLPTYGARGPEFPEGAVRPLVRTYTPRWFDAAAGELAIDFVLHGHGSAAAWAEAARPGDRAGVSGPGSGYDPDPAAPWFVIAGDESALPAMATIVEALPDAATAHVVAEVPSPLDRIDLVSPGRLITTWLERDGQPSGQLLEAELRAMHVPVGPGCFWVAGESAVVRRIRDHLVEGRGVPKDRYVVRAYWKAEPPEAAPVSR